MTKVKQSFLRRGLGTRASPATKLWQRKYLPIVDNLRSNLSSESSENQRWNPCRNREGDVRSKTISILTSNWNTTSSKQDWLYSSWSMIQQRSIFHPPKSPSRFRGRCSSKQSLCWKRAFLSLCWEMTWWTSPSQWCLAIDQPVMNDYDEASRQPSPMEVPHESASYGVIASRRRH